ncbi:hypothetical protein IFR05_001791 [Cadophora sp. M221]|nr:hypothetical protein IFR05_001791 [Cadophora sp. M221]
MSSSAVASYSADKSPNMSAQGYEELGSDFFDQFLTYSPTDDDEIDDHPLTESTFLKRSENHLGGASLSSTDDEDKYMVAQEPWQGDSWAVDGGNVASQTTSADQFYTSGRAAISDSELLSLEGIYLESPQISAHTQTSLPSSPTQGPVHTLRRRNCIVESLSKTFKKASASLDKSILRSPIRKAKSNPAMMRTTHQSNSHLDLWGRKLDLEATKFNFDFEQDDLRLSLLSSARVPDVLQLSNSADHQRGELIDELSYKHTLTQHMPRPSAYDTPLSTPTLDRYPSRRTSQQLRSDSALFPITPQAQNASSSWSQLPDSPHFNNYDGKSSTYPEIDSPLWWNHAAAAPMAQPSPGNFYTNPQRSSKSLALQLQNDLAYNGNDIGYSPSDMANGLMIQMPGTSAQRQSVVIGTSPMLPPPGYFPSSFSQPHQHQHQQRANHNRQKVSHHARSRHPQQSSPTRKSRSGSSDSESPSPSSPSPAAFHARKRKTPKSSKQSTPRIPTTGSSTVDFINYTPSDSRKILTGVAPSGSSKTKARREKEALDKRRKLSQAALRAVRAAGGDIDSLVEQGLFV